MSDGNDRADGYKEPISSQPPPFDENVPLIVGQNPVDGTVVVHQYRHPLALIAGGLMKIFEGASKGENPASTVRVYTKEEFEKEAPNWAKSKQELDEYISTRENLPDQAERNELLNEAREFAEENPDAPVKEVIGHKDVADPEDIKFVTLEQYKALHALIDGNNYASNGSYIDGVEVDMEGRMTDVGTDVSRFHRGIVAQQVGIDHKQELLESLKNDSGNISLKVAMQSTDGMTFESEDFLEIYNADKVAILVAEDSVGGIVHLRHPEEGKVGEFDDAFVYRTKAELDELRGDGLLVTSQQLTEDMLSKRLGLHDRQEIEFRLEEMGFDWDKKQDIEEGGDLKAFQKDLGGQQDALNSLKGAFPDDFKGAQLDTSAKAEVAAPMN